MKSLLAYSHKIATVVLFLFATIGTGQDRAIERFKVGEDALVEVDVSYADVVFETWSKNTVAVETYIEAEGLSNKEKKEAFDSWDVDVLGNSKKVIISSVFLESISRSIESISANLLNNTAFPSMTGFEAMAPKSPIPRIAEPLLITATKFPLLV